VKEGCHLALNLAEATVPFLGISGRAPAILSLRMLILDHPLTQYVFEAARYEDEIRRRLVALESEPQLDADPLLREILAGPLPQLRRLLHERFDDRPGIASKLDALEVAITERRPLTEIWSTFLRLDELSEDTFGTAFI
jgi:hypothetical protein